MSEFFIGQISMFSFNFAPKFWAQCNGQFLPIQQNSALFALLGTQFGGNGITNFALPNMQGRTPVGFDSNAVQMGQAAGLEVVTLTSTQMPAHSHKLGATSTTANKRVPSGKMLAADNASVAEYYAVPSAGPTTTLDPQSVSIVGGSQPHNNMQPYSVINFCIALNGIFPSRN